MNDLEKAIKDAGGDVLYALELALKKLKRSNNPCPDFGRCNCAADCGEH
jgi:hypothetical protein